MGDLVKKLVAVMSVTAVSLLGVVTSRQVAEAVPVQPAASAVRAVAWSPCPEDDPVLGSLLKGLECGSLEVPLNYSKPKGEQIALALTRAKHTSTDAQYQGIVLLNRGQWPGGIGRDLPTRYATGTAGLPLDVAATYDWIGFDPRGVGASEPGITCDSSYIYPDQAQADPVPHSAAEERAWVTKARAYARSCGDKYGSTLKYLTTENGARDLDQVRQALGQDQINYLGYDYGSYLGSVYASLYPQRVRRMILDSVVQPSKVWYKADLVQNKAAEKRAKIFFGWIATYDSVYGLGTSEAAVEANYYKGLAAITKQPIDGKVGPNEYTDMFSVDVNRTYTWVAHAQMLADWVLRGDGTKLKANFTIPGYPHQNRQATYNASQCGDSPFPRDWAKWSADYTRSYKAGNTFMTWKDAWYNAPCAFWPTAAGKPVKIGRSGVNVLLVQPENDPVHSTGGAMQVHELFPDSRLVLERDGNNLGASLSANKNACLNTYVSDYLRDGTRPARTKGVDATCAPSALPVPTSAAAVAASQAFAQNPALS